MAKLIGAAILMICLVESSTCNPVFVDKVLIKGRAIYFFKGSGQ
jgi:hypothetical protein